ncbi:hypothetical protein, partial [Nocardioides sp.]|uniref:hypothetical protein n=1 Tax=Nocardioides sp. TaxID=35761 RepID=UPI0031FF3243
MGLPDLGATFSRIDRPRHLKAFGSCTPAYSTNKTSACAARSGSRSAGNFSRAATITRACSASTTGPS